MSSPPSPARRRPRRWRAPLRAHALGVALVALAGLGGAHAVRADPPTVHVVPAGDVALASLVLLAAGTTAPVVLFDPEDVEALRRFLAPAGAPVECTARPVTPATERALLEASAGVPCAAVESLPALARRLWPRATTAVAVPAADYAMLLRAAALAAAAGAALVPVDDAAALAPALAGWPLDTLYALPGTAPPAGEKLTVVRLESADAVARETLRRLAEPPRTLVIANPRDRDGLFSPSALSLLAPLIAASHHAPLILVAEAAPEAIEAEVQRFIAANRLAPTHLFLVGDELALRSHRVPDPVLEAGGPEALGGGREVRVELFSEVQRGQPQDYAVGRFVAEDAALGSLTLARQLHTGLGTGERVVVLSNADQEFALGETISRTTVGELRNAGVKVRARYGDAVTPAVIQESLEQAGLLMWEGHARDLTLEERGGVAVQRTPPLVVLQGCYTLDRSDPFILFERGTQAIVATSAAIYSASGSAFGRALLDTLLYDGADLGTAVRNARNYLLALSELKKRRQHDDWPKTYRAALAFALWGDPTARPNLPRQAPKIPPVQWRTDADSLALTIPKRRLAREGVEPYAADPVPRAMLGGLVLREGDSAERALKELFYDVVAAPAPATAACAPDAAWEVVSLFAPHTGTLSVLARPPGPGAPSGDFRLPLATSPAACRPAAKATVP